MDVAKDSSILDFEGASAISFTRLYPITPAQSLRYTKSPRVALAYQKIEPGQFSCANEPEPSYLPEDWYTYVQPEGSAYYYNKRDRVVTEANVCSSKTHCLVMARIREVQNIAREKGLVLSENVELYLQIDDDGACGYYFVDHASRTEFWLEHMSSEDVGFPASSSSAQLRWAFQEHYWMHVEYFPMHNGIFASIAISELISILLHARGDHLTSSVGTFPYNAVQCQEFVAILRERAPTYMDGDHFEYDGYALCFAARIWTQVARHRFLNFYGEAFARLSRDQHMIEHPPSQCPLILRPAVKVLFNLPRSFVSELDKLWVDNLVYADPYKQFLTNCVAEWNNSTKAAFVLFALHIVFVTRSFGSYEIGLASVALSATSFVIGMILSHYHRMPLNFDTADAADYLSQSHLGAVYGFHPLSIVYSLPKGLVGWSAIAVVLQTLVAAYTTASSAHAAGDASFSFQVFVGALVMLAALVIASVLGIMRRSFAVYYVSEDETASSSSASRWINTVTDLFTLRSCSSRNEGSFV